MASAYEGDFAPVKSELEKRICISIFNCFIFVFIFFWVLLFFNDKATSALYFTERLWFLTLGVAGIVLWVVFGY